MKTSISIIIPAYNAENYIHECIMSIRPPSNVLWECLVVDDGSIDKTYQIIDALAQSNKHIKVIEQENQGALSARLTGLNQSTGEYCIFLDSDDLLRKDAIEVINKAIVDNNCPDIINYGITLNSKFKEISEFYTPLPVKLNTADENYIEILKKNVCSGVNVNLASKAIKRKVLLAAENEIRNNTSINKLNYGEDWLFTLCVLEAANNAVYIPEPLYFYRHNDLSTSNSYKPYHLDSLKKTLDKLERLSDDWGSDYAQMARKAELVHLSYLTRNCALCTASKRDRYREFGRIKLEVRRIIDWLDERNVAINLRIDHRTLIKSLNNGSYEMCDLISQVLAMVTKPRRE